MARRDRFAVKGRGPRTPPFQHIPEVIQASNEPVYVPPMAQDSSNLTREEIETGVGEQPPVNFYTEAFTANDNQKNRPPVDGPAVDAFNLRKDANEAARAATDQYEADVAAYKDTEATEAETGIASLPEFSADERDMMDSGSYDDGSVAAPPVSGTPVPLGTGDPYYDYNNDYNIPEDMYGDIDDLEDKYGITPEDLVEIVDSYPSDVPPSPPPIYQPPVNEEPPIYIPPPIDDGRPRNIYTGRPIRDPYVPYEEPSKEMAEYTRPMSAENFGSSPGMGPQINPPREPIFANNGGNLDKGLSRLPLNEQNDTLTQIFQAGFRPRR